ncbi:MAG: type I restriction enzyme HsdR N-terminal domain-containing protein [Bacteroidota bacterium]
MSLIKRGLKDRYIALDKKKDQLIYLPQGKQRRYSNPEEKVQLETYLELIYHYGYPPEQLRVCKKVKIGSSSREADIVVYRDKEAKDPLVIVECKKAGVSNSVFQEAIEQGFSYAAVTNAEYVWATSGDRDAYFTVFPDAIQERKRNKIRRIPHRKDAGKKRLNVGRSIGSFLRHPTVTDTLVYALVLVLTTVVASKLAVEYFSQLYKATKWLWEQHNMDFNWIYNTIIAVAAFFSLTFGTIFMRSHKLFSSSPSRKRLTFFLMALILFIPSWYIGESVNDPSWWKWGHYETLKGKGYPIWMYLWPYLKSLPLQLFAIWGLIALIGRGKDKK